MHLRTVRLRGFKSFVEPVELRLEPGVAVVVGPNGSGKSNVADAIVWAAGSLTPSELRAEKPDDVLFAGGGDRPAADHCEVELVFDNEGGAFPELDFSEVSIARRLVRGGEGQYLVNGASVRRTDLVELLADAGLGGAMHSIVSQGKVETVLASRPEDRRHLVEEAAGLGKFKRRRHRAELKLARVSSEVARARDVEEEARRRLRPLALQATAAERAERLAGEIAALQARIAQLDLDAVAERRAAVEAERDAAALARRRTQERLAALLAEREQAEADLSDAAGGRESALGALYRLQGAAERIELRRESAAALAGRLEDELAQAERARAASSDETLQRLERAAAAAAVEARERAQASAGATERARRACERLGTCERERVAEVERKLEEARARRRDGETELAALAGGEDGLRRRLLALGGARERVALRRESVAAACELVREDLAQARALVRAGGPGPAALEAAADEARATARAAAGEHDDLAERARSARARLAALEQAVAQREGIPPAARALASSGETLALSALEAEPGAELAIAAALSWRAAAILVRSTRAGLELLEQARREGLGSLGVVAGGSAAPRRDPPHPVAPPHPGARPLRELARGDEAALRLLDGLWLTDREHLLDAAHGTVVTLEGHGYDSDRGELWLAGETAEVLLLELEARRRQVEDEVGELEARARSAGAAAGEAAVRARGAEEAFAAVAHLRGRACDPALLDRVDRVATELEAVLARAAAAALELERPLAAQAAAASSRSVAVGAELQRLAALEQAVSRELAEALAAAQAAEVAAVRLGGASERPVPVDGADRDVLVREAEELVSAAERSAAEARDAAGRAAAAEQELAARLPRRVAVAPALLARLGEAARSLEGELGRCAALASRLQAPVRARVDAGAERAGRLGAELRRLGAAEVELRGESEQAGERATRVQVELARLEAEAAEAGRRLAAAGAAAPAEGDDRGALLERAERLERRRETLGRVNPLAREEYEEEKERLEQLGLQRRDLEESLAELAKLRDELADTVERRFRDTFAAVAGNFEDVAGTLFPGGEGRLRLVEPDEEGEEPGIEVELRPAGKRITRLSLLSGGEKALCAISFLFALFLARPCPFYLLDEVEAALDDSNIVRFVELLRRYAGRAQFIVITHQKRTMEAADVLYGVTMGPDGISQVVSRRLPQQHLVEAGAAT